MTTITKLYFDKQATPMALYKLQDATCNLFNTFMAVKPASCERKKLKDLTDDFVVNIYKIIHGSEEVSNRSEIKAEVKKLLAASKKLGLGKIDLKAVNRAINRARIAASL